ncbi:MAG: hypothetical protein ACJAS4_001359 [Bacteriovoracaceae bacterium]|jgi:hypothetical protein
MTLLKKLKIYSIIIVPVLGPEQFLDLQYSDLKPNIVSIKESITLKVDRSASPLFYKFKDVKIHKDISIVGNVKIESHLKSEEKDSYFQLGVVYAGDYRPNFFVRKILPEWLLKILNINNEYGVGNIDFYHVSGNSTQINKKDNIRDIQISFKTITNLKKNGEFEFSVPMRDKKILGLWLRADGDDHHGKFETTLTKISVN